jgi:hypothetical protein
MIMAAIARQTMRKLLPLDMRRLFAAPTLFGGRGASEAAPAELLTARALASVGAAALVALPLLMLASLAASAPLAAPAIIALGYFAIADAVASRRAHREAAWSLAVFAGFIVWALLFVLAGGEPRSAAGFLALLLAPAFAAAPGLARWLLAPGGGRGRKAASEQARCLDQLAPSEAVIFVDASGRMLAATQAGLKAGGLSATGAGMDMVAGFSLPDRPSLLHALRDCRAGRGPVEVALRDGAGAASGRHVAATVAAGPHGTASLRLSAPPPPVENEPPEPAVEPALDTAHSGPAVTAGPAADVQEALSFAVTRLAPKARARGLALACEGDCEIFAACERSACRRILHLMIDTAISVSAGGGLVRVAARRLKGAVLLRVSAAAPADIDAGAFGLAALRDMIERANGTLVVERRGDEIIASARLAAGAAPVAEQRSNRGAS